MRCNQTFPHWAGLESGEAQMKKPIGLRRVNAKSNGDSVSVTANENSGVRMKDRIERNLRDRKNNIQQLNIIIQDSEDRTRTTKF